jgi:WD40 repeat protein/transcriptional regulator with XRE-family HTH domain
MSRQLLMPPKKCGVTKSSSSVNKSGIIRRVKEEGESRGRKGAHVKRPAYEEHDYAFGQAMQTLRTTIGLTQASLAQMLGVSRRAVGEWEAGSSYPKAEHLQHLLELAVQQRVFPSGREEEEIRAFWQAAHQKVLLDEAWLAALLPAVLAEPSAPPGAVPAAEAAGAQVGSAPPPAPSDGAPPGPPPPSSEPLASRVWAGRSPQMDWGEALDVPSFYGREEELAMLDRWVLEERCRVVSVLGMGGVGKSALSVALMRQVAEHFQVVLWRSLRDAPDCSALLAECLRVVSPQPLSDLPSTVEARLGRLLSALGELRVLLVLDNLESVLQAGEARGQFRSDHEDYARLLQAVAGRAHQSCLLLTSREKPAVLRVLEGRQAPVRSLRLSGLEEAASEQILSTHELLGSPQERARLIELYKGNPLALHMMAETIADLFGGELAPFLAQETLVFGSISELLDEHWSRLSALEQALLCWLAIVREPVTIEEVQRLLVARLAPVQLFEALDGLQRRSLVERGQRSGSFTLHSVVLEYATTRLIKEAAGDIEGGRLARLVDHGLELATAKDYVRQTQTRLLVAPLLAHLLHRYQGRETVESRLLALLAQLRERADTAQGYGPANLLALLREQRGHLRGLDLSRLSIREAYLQGVEMQDTSLSGATLRDVIFTSAFDMILSVAVSPDGRSIAAGSNSGQVRLWREEGRVAHLTFQGHTDRVTSIAFSPDGRALATAGWEGTVKLWDVESGALLWTTEDQRLPVISLAINPRGKLVSGSYDGAIQMWDLRTGKHLARLHTPGGRILTLTWSADGRLLASGGPDAIIRLWDGEQGTRLGELPGHDDLVCALAFAPGSQTSLLASGSFDQAVKLWDTQTGSCLRTLSGHTNLVAGLAWSPDGCTLASASHDMSLRLWDAQTGQCRHLLQGHTDAVTSVAFLPTGERLLSSGDRTLRLWDVQSGQNVRTMQGYALALYALAWSPDGRFLVSGSSEATLTLWNVATRTPVQVLRGHRIQVYAVAWSRATNRIASGSEDHTVRLWDAQTGVCTHVLQGHTANVSSVDWSVDGRFLASGSYDGSIRLWDMQEDDSRVALEQVGVVSAVVWSPDGTLLACANEEGLVLIFRADDGVLVRRFEHAGAVGALCWSPDGEQLVSGAVDGERGVLSIWDRHQGSLVRRLEGHTGFIWGLDWSPQEDLLLSAGADGTVRWWDLQQGVHLATLQAHEGWARTLHISPDGKIIASCGHHGTIGLWDLHSHQHLATLRTERPYERLDISNVRGLTSAQKAALQALGAVSAEHTTSLL